MRSRHPFLAALALLALSSCRSDGGETSPTPSASVDAASAPQPTGSADAAATASASSPAGQAPASEALPVVDLAGHTHLPPPASPNGPRLASRSMITRVYERPTASSKMVGSLRAGAIVEMLPEAAGTDGCKGGWRRIQPYGYVCVGDDATLDLDDPIVRASSRRPDFTQSLPYMYGIATRGGPVYAKIPTAEEQAEFEPSLSTHLAKWKSDKVSGATYGLDVWLRWRGEAPTALEALSNKTTDKDIPFYLTNGGRVPNLSGKVKSADAVKIDEVSRRTGLAFVDSFLDQGRRMNVTTDLRVIPADRFRPIRGSDFHGWEIGKDVELPVAIVRRGGGKLYTLKNGKLVADGELEYRSAHELTGKQRFHEGHLHYETKDGHWVSARYAGRVDPAKRMPKWGTNGEKWLDVNITKQILVAYEGTKPVYVTLVSSGADGLADHETTKASKRGIFRIHTKYASITMDSDVVGEEFELRDVPYVQYYEGGYALHSAYWHDTFGTPRSHGCLNLAPEDARRIFFWTEPQLPPGWHGVARPLTGTVVFIHA